MLAFLPLGLRAPVNMLAGVVECSVGVATLAAAALGSKRGAWTAAAAALGVLVAVFPANVYVAISSQARAATGQPLAFALVRLAIQATFCVWAAWPMLPLNAAARRA